MTVSTTADLNLVLQWSVPFDTGAGNQNASVLTSYIIMETTVQWEVNISVDSTLVTLTRGPLSKGYTYSYRITAVNPAGFSSTSTAVSEMAISKPSPPLSLSSAVVGSLVLFFRWTPPVDTGNLGYGQPIPLQQYQLHVVVDSSHSLVKIFPLPFDSTNYTITPSLLLLSPGVLYDFRLFAQNAAGLSPPTDIFQIPIASPTAPQSPSAAVTSPLEITVNWQLPFNTGGIAQEILILNYTVFLSLTYTFQNKTLLYQGPSTAFVHLGLIQAQTYFYTIIAENAAGISPSAGPVGEEGVVLPTAPDLQVKNSADLELTASWTAPADTGTGGQLRALLAYLLEMDTVAISNGSFAGSPFGAGCYQSQTPSCDPSHSGAASVFRGLGVTAAFPALVKGMTYYLRVSAINAAGAGPASVVVARQALVLPSVPRSFEMNIATANGSLVLQLQWKLPAETGAGVTPFGQLPPPDPTVPGTALTAIEYISQVCWLSAYFHFHVNRHSTFTSESVHL